MNGELHILLVEDNPFDADVIEATLRAHFGCLVTTVESKIAFEAELNRHTPDFILSDSNVPSFDGLEAFALAQQKCPEIPFIFCSGRASEKIKTESSAGGAVDFVSKDDLESLVALVARLVGEAQP